MRKIKQQNKKVVAVGNGTKMKIAIIGISVLIVLLIGFMLLESAMSRKLTVENHTTKNIESLQIYFENGEDFQSTDLYNDALGAGTTHTGNFTPVKMQGESCEMILSVKFEGGETITLNDGYFHGIYKGRIKASFTESEDGKILLHLTAGVGITNSTNETYCDTVFNLDPLNGEWEFED